MTSCLPNFLNSFLIFERLTNSLQRNSYELSFFRSLPNFTFYRKCWRHPHKNNHATRAHEEESRLFGLGSLWIIPWFWNVHRCRVRCMGCGLCCVSCSCIAVVLTNWIVWITFKVDFDCIWLFIVSSLFHLRNKNLQEQINNFPTS